MSQDTLSDVLRTVRLRCVLYVSGGREAAEAPASKDIASAVMPGAEHVIEYHVVTDGDCWAASSVSRRFGSALETSCCFLGDATCCPALRYASRAERRVVLRGEA